MVLRKNVGWRPQKVWVAFCVIFSFPLLYPVSCVHHFWKLSIILYRKKIVTILVHQARFFCGYSCRLCGVVDTAELKLRWVLWLQRKSSFLSWPLVAFKGTISPKKVCGEHSYSILELKNQDCQILNFWYKYFRKYETIFENALIFQGPRWISLILKRR